MKIVDRLDEYIRRLADGWYYEVDEVRVGPFSSLAEARAQLLFHHDWLIGKD